MLFSCSPEFERSQPPPSTTRAGMGYTPRLVRTGGFSIVALKEMVFGGFFLLEFGNYLWSLNINVKQLGSNTCLVLVSLTQCFITVLNKIYLIYILIYIFIVCFSPALEVIAATPDLSISRKPIKEKPLDFLQCSLLKLKITDAAPQPFPSSWHTLCYPERPFPRPQEGKTNTAIRCRVKLGHKTASLRARFVVVECCCRWC